MDSQEWVPAQYKQPDMPDFRRSETTVKSFKENPKYHYKRKRAEVEPADSEDAQCMDYQETVVRESTCKRARVEGAPYRFVSGKVWKAAGEKAGTLKPKSLSTSWEKKMANKAVAKTFSEQKQAAVTAVKEKRKAAADQKRKALERKAANREKSQVVQKITNVSKLKKMMKNKKQKKLLKTADTS